MRFNNVNNNPVETPQSQDISETSDIVGSENEMDLLEQEKLEQQKLEQEKLEQQKLEQQKLEQHLDDEDISNLIFSISLLLIPSSTNLYPVCFSIFFFLFFFIPFLLKAYGV